MPQISVDYSEGLIFDRRGFARALHALTAKVIGGPIADCKTRFRRTDETFISDGAEMHAMVFVEFWILSGRTTAIKAQLSESTLALLQESVTSPQGSQLHLAVSVCDLDSDVYRRVRVST
ncbi:5-carboxymethyl-2-hydroxymuconate Delta-isomerase [Streptomyces sp. BK340]|uniref:5-carboxymethyl-2-hydroxymuconate Delta-isomerase n=1 Tax=Streptomyces sp. BK340 TaxID=2572903 RepID=UPI0011A6C42B|nr:isomerase [Streptomyces sp. BK340]TVZ90411.1 5-carboxymethyl-2-hydroxymuconate isomerase [Streptomyces sp. BK340]